MKKTVTAIAVMGLFSAALFAADKPVTVMMKDAAGKDVGTAKISDGPGGSGVKIALSLKGLPPDRKSVV